MGIQKRYRLTFWIFAGFIMGIIAGLLGGESLIPYVSPLAEIFLRMLRMAIIPLVIPSITSSVIKVGSAKNLGKIGLRTLLYYLFTSLIAIITGQLLVNILKPGVGADIGLEASPVSIEAVESGIGNILLNIIPENPFRAMADGDVLPVIFFSILFGYFVAKLGEERRKIMGGWFEAAFDAMMKMTGFIIWTAPAGVFGIITEIVASTGFSAFGPLGYYFLIVLAGLAIHMFVTLPVILYTITGKNPVDHYKGMMPALLTAFSTCSTIVTLPLTIKAVTVESGGSERAAGFVLPIGATMNMDGTALYECVATIFIAQVYGFDLGFTAQVTIAVTALLASVGAASIPMSGMVMMSIILSAVGLPLEGVAIILAVDRILDMFRTMANVFSDSVGALVISRLEENDENRQTPGS